MRPIMLCFILLSSVFARPDPGLQYEPAVVHVTGTLVKGKHQHPNGSWFDVLLLKLTAPSSIKGDGAADSINVGEDHIKEIQVFSLDTALLKKLGAMSGKEVTLTGTLFHSHTAWHVRELVLTVTAVK